jgi:hypothetical protein
MCNACKTFDQVAPIIAESGMNNAECISLIARLIAGFSPNNATFLILMASITREAFEIMQSNPTETRH